MLFFCALAISVISLVTIISGIDVFGKRTLIMQGAMTVVGIAILFFIANLDYQEIVDKLYIVMFIGSAVFLASVLIFGRSVGTNKSWIDIIKIGGTKISIQPSEFVKASFIVSFSKHLDIVKEKINNPKCAISLVIHAGIIIGLILISGDLGVALVYVGIAAVMLFCAGLSKWYFIGGLGAVLLSAPLAWRFLEPYQKERILVGFNPDIDPYGRGLHQIMCRKAIANGGVFGQGFNGGTAYKDLFAADTDCIFATYCEKFGLVGAAVLITLYIIMIVRIINIGRRARKSYGGYICAGVAGMLIVQTVENIGMCLCMLPLVGITLPFMSAGGSSVLAIYIIFGMVHSVRARRVKYYSERIKDR